MNSQFVMQGATRRGAKHSLQDHRAEEFEIMPEESSLKAPSKYKYLVDVTLRVDNRDGMDHRIDANQR
jgi:hypothetical protein